MREQRCRVCRHPQRAEIDKALVQGVSVRLVSAQFGSVSRAAVQRHAAKHLPASLAQAEAVVEVARVDSLLDDLRDQVRRADNLFTEAQGVLEVAKESGDGGRVLDAVKAAALALREARNSMELLGRLAGRLQDGATVNLVMSPDWQRVRGAILEALRPYPAAIAAVASALRSLGNTTASFTAGDPALPARERV